MNFNCGTCGQQKIAVQFPPPYHYQGKLFCEDCFAPDRMLLESEKEAQVQICKDVVPEVNGQFIVNCPYCQYDGTYSLPDTLYSGVTCKCQRGCRKDFQWVYEFDEHKYKVVSSLYLIANENHGIKTPQTPSETPEQKMNERRDKLLREFLLPPYRRQGL